MSKKATVRQRCWEALPRPLLTLKVASPAASRSERLPAPGMRKPDTQWPAATSRLPPRRRAQLHPNILHISTGAM